MRILVTGAAGFIGSHLVEALRGLGHDVVGIDCFTDYYARPLKDLNASHVLRSGAKMLSLDLATDNLCAALEGCDVLYHLAAQPGISATTPFDLYLRNNVVATHNLLEAARKSSAPPFVVNIATSSVYGHFATDSEQTPPKPISHYGVTKLAAEQLTLSYGRDERLKTCSLRIFSAIGPRERPEKLFPRLIGSILAGKEFVLYQGSRDHSRSFSFVGDLVDGLVSVLDRMDACTGQIINLGSDHEHTTGESIEVVEALLGTKAKIVQGPPRPGDQMKTKANIAKAREILGFDPKTDIEESLRAEVDWYRDDIFPLAGSGEAK